MLNSPGWLQYIGQRNVNTAEEAKKYILEKIINSYNVNGFGFYLVLLKETGEPMGICGFAKRDYLEDPDIGFAFLPGFEGKGYAYEAALSCLEYADEELKLNCIGAITIKNNTRSISLLIKLGLRFERIITDPVDNSELLLYYSLRGINHKN